MGDRGGVRRGQVNYVGGPALGVQSRVDTAVAGTDGGRLRCRGLGSPATTSTGGGRGPGGRAGRKAAIVLYLKRGRAGWTGARGRAVPGAVTTWTTRLDGAGRSCRKVQKSRSKLGGHTPARSWGAAGFVPVPVQAGDLGTATCGGLAGLGGSADDHLPDAATFGPRSLWPLSTAANEPATATQHQGLPMSACRLRPALHRTTYDARPG